MRNEFIRVEICPICGKRYIPAAQHLYRANNELVCSWGCQRKVEKENEAKKKEREKHV